ncbi:hypothetical protein [Fluviicola sp.]|uniref:hypothetical protein n=1 Tax=Fluviicola sp. TaxID=1917219 RepID=UPI00262A5346|nr:hypothetical protein [Fluviicola sp.]
MKAKVKNPSQVQFDNVYISELNKIVHIYKNTTSQISSGKNNKLSSDFGLPLTIAVNDNQLIGFASATLNLSGEVEMNCFFSEKSDETEVESQLKEQAYRNFYKTYDNSETGKKQLKASIERLVYWLNL